MIIKTETKDNVLNYRKGYYLLKNIIYIAGFLAILSIIKPLFTSNLEQIKNIIILYSIFFIIHRSIMKGHYISRFIYLSYINICFLYIILSTILLAFGSVPLWKLNNLFEIIVNTVSFDIFKIIDIFSILALIILVIYSEIMFFFNKDVSHYLSETKKIDINYKKYLKKKLLKPEIKKSIEL